MLAFDTVQERLNDPVALHMKTDLARLNVNQTIEDALSTIRQTPPSERIIYFYVLDDQGQLKGVVPTRRLLLNSPEKRIRDIMVREVIAVPHTATVLDVCEFFIFHRLLAFPVVNESHQLIGAVDVELYTDELNDLDRREGNDDLFQLIGVHLTDSRQTSPSVAFKSRFPWLLTNILGGVLAAFISGIFQAELQEVVALALFIPVVLALAESVSIQSVSLALQALRGGRPSLLSIFRKTRAEMVTGMLLGAASAAVVSTVAIVWIGQIHVVTCLFGGILGGVVFAAAIGVAIPNLLRFFRCEPQVAAGPIALASTDMATLTIYFSLARWLLA
ncbi:magnesium transporter [Bremerella alba]|nr:magnesium transporter [Bremerella alba]